MSNYVLDKGFIAAAVTTQFKAVKFGTADNTCTPVTGTTDLVLGIAQEVCATADIGLRVINVRVCGISECLYGGTVTRGDKLKVTAAGLLITATADTENVVGVALTSGVINDRGQVLLTPANAVAATPTTTVVGDQASIADASASKSPATQLPLVVRVTSLPTPRARVEKNNGLPASSR